VPAAVILILRPVVEGRLPLSHGSLAHAAALDLFLRIDPPLGASLHGGNAPKPFTVGPVSGPGRREGFELVLSPDAVYTWRLTGLTDPVAEALLKMGAAGGIRLGQVVFEVEGLAGRPDEHPEAGRDDYGELLRRWSMQAPPAQVTLDFKTPTTFRVGRIQQPFPLPRWVFGSLLRGWNAFGPGRLELEPEGLDERLAVANWRGETRRVELGPYGAVGFVGRCTYRLADPDPQLGRTIGLLAEFAFYAGVGWQTTHGLGQVRPEFRPRAA
jgi:CRISPR-associated endoribonuclease Cas6